MERILIRGARILDPASHRDRVGDLLLAEGRVAALGENLAAEGARVVEAAGLVAAPGLVDMHVHLRDPGFTHKEDILSGCRAAAAGGFTAVACMPNTKPPCDSPQVLAAILDKAKNADARVYPVACITRGMAGEELCDLEALRAAGAVAVSDDGRPVKNAALLKAGLEAAYGAGLLVTSHCEDLDIIGDGKMNLGQVSRRLGVPGMDRTSEDTVTAREILLAAATGTRVHIAHVSTKGSVGIIRLAKTKGCPVTCETAPHYMLLTDSALEGRDANFRMNPPLRTEEDRQAIVEGLADGTIDAIATDHAPHTPEEKADFLAAPNGIIGLETSLGASYKALVETGYLNLLRLVELMSLTPARLLGVEGGTLAVGAPADVVLFDPAARWTVQPEQLRSKGRNTPFGGWELPCRVRATLLGGRITHWDFD